MGKNMIMDIFPSGSVVKNPPANAGDTSLIPVLERSCAPFDGLGTEPGCPLANLAMILLPLFPWVLTHFLNLEV